MLEETGNNDSEGSELSGFEKFISCYRTPITFLLIAVILVGLGMIYTKKRQLDSLGTIQVLEATTVPQNNKEIVVEVAGSVVNPGVYKLNKESRVDDAIKIAGGLKNDADKNWMEKYINRAAKISDGQKIFIASISDVQNNSVKQTNVLSAKENGDDQTVSLPNSTVDGGVININTSSQKELESLIGIGPVYAQKIIEQRPYSDINELLSKKVIPQKTFENIKNKISVY